MPELIKSRVPRRPSTAAFGERSPLFRRTEQNDFQVQQHERNALTSGGFNDLLFVSFFYDPQESEFMFCWFAFFSSIAQQRKKGLHFSTHRIREDLFLLLCYSACFFSISHCCKRRFLPDDQLKRSVTLSRTRSVFC